MRIDAARIGDAAARIAERDDFRFLLRKQARHGRADIAESLNRDAGAAQRNLFQLAGFFDHVNQPARRRFVAPVRNRRSKPACR